MTAVRPPLWPQAQSAPVNRGGAQSPAQKAFFDAALGRAGGAQPTQAAAPVEPVQNRTPTYAAPARAQPQPAAEGEVKYRRPGSIIDIRV